MVGPLLGNYTGDTMENVTTISVDSKTKKLVESAKQYKGQTYDELLRETFSDETESEETRS